MRRLHFQVIGLGIINILLQEAMRIHNAITFNLMHQQRIQYTAQTQFILKVAMP